MKRYNIIATFFVVLFLMSMNQITIQNSDQDKKLDSLARDRAQHLSALREAIKGRETLPADSVFGDIQILKSVPAGRLLAIMDLGYSQSLGVSCGHCHNTEKWESNEKAAKNIAREMHKFSAEVREMLNNIDLLKDRKPIINCTTCHRGNTKPALNLAN